MLFLSINYKYYIWQMCSINFNIQHKHYEIYICNLQTIYNESSNRKDYKFI